MRITFILASSQAPIGNQLDFRYLTRLVNGAGKTGGTSLMGCMPLALPTLAALTPPGVEMKIVDENVEPVEIDNDSADVVAISFLTMTSERAYALADAFRRRGAHVVLGGVHATIFPEEALEHADTVVVGEAEESWPRFVEDFRRGRPERIYRCDAPPDLGRLVIPRWDLLNGRYYNTRHVQTTRGCAFDCDFCAVRAFLGTPRHKPVENVVQEILAIRRYNKVPGMFRVAFADDNIVSSKRYAKELFRALAPLKLRWSSQCSVNIAFDDELLELAERSGCESLLIGFESLSQENLTAVNKAKVNRVDEYREAIARLHGRRIMVYPMIMLGLEGDDPMVFEQLASFMRETGVAFPVFNILTPIPGTRLYARLEREGRILHHRWNEYNGSHVCFSPKNLTARELQDGFSQILKELYSYEAIWSRLTRLWEGGVARLRRRYDVARVLVTLRLLTELLQQRGEMGRMVRRTIVELWRRSGISISLLLINLNFFEYASRLP